jgi:hypothetical protein
VPVEIKTTGQRKPAVRSTSAVLRRLGAEIATLKSNVAVLDRELDRLKAAAFGEPRPKLEAIGVLKDLPLSKLEMEALAEMRQTARDENSDHSVEVSAQ